MKCPKCKSKNVNVQIVSEQVVKTYEHSFILKLFYWMIKPIIWICLLPFKMLFIFFPKKNEYSFTKHKKIAICQNCGKTWKIR